MQASQMMTLKVWSQEPQVPESHKHIFKTQIPDPSPALVSPITGGRGGSWESAPPPSDSGAH